MSLKSYIPSERIRPYVRSLMISESGEAATYKVLPGTGIVMGFQYSGRLSYEQAGEAKQLQPAGITGLMDSYRLFSNTAGTGTVLVLFSETGAAAFFPQAMHELFNQSLGLDDLLLRSQMDVVVERLCEAADDDQRIGVVENFLASRLGAYRPDELVNLAVSIIVQHAGNIRITQLAEKLHISQGRLEKRFRKVVGASPKKFASIVRVRHLVDHAKAASIAQVGFEAGYFDQAHFIRDFKSFTGHTPGTFFGQE